MPPRPEVKTDIPPGRHRGTTYIWRLPSQALYEKYRRDALLQQLVVFISSTPRGTTLMRGKADRAVRFLKQALEGLRRWRAGGANVPLHVIFNMERALGTAQAAARRAERFRGMPTRMAFTEAFLRTLDRATLYILAHALEMRL